MYFEDYHVGQAWDIEPFLVSRDQILAFADAYDPLPLHLSEEHAATTRFGGLIASGFQTLILFWGHFMREYGPSDDGLIAGQGFQAQWPNPLYAGDSIRGTVTVSSLTKRNPYNGSVTFDLAAYNQSGEPVLIGWAKVCVKTAVGT
jgi:acyl dehydratase